MSLQWDNSSLVTLNLQDTLLDFFQSRNERSMLQNTIWLPVKTLLLS